MPGYQPRSDEDRIVHVNHVSDDYFRTFGMQPAGGPRVHAARCRPMPSRSPIINEASARAYFGRRSPIGETIRFGPADGYQIVGHRPRFQAHERSRRCAAIRLPASLAATGYRRAHHAGRRVRPAEADPGARGNTRGSGDPLEHADLRHRRRAGSDRRHARQRAAAFDARHAPLRRWPWDWRRSGSTASELLGGPPTRPSSAFGSRSDRRARGSRGTSSAACCCRSASASPSACRWRWLRRERPEGCSSA